MPERFCTGTETADYTSATVSRQIASSSFVRNNCNLTLESGVEINNFFSTVSVSIFVKCNAKVAEIAYNFLVPGLAFSPIPAVNTIASTPFIAAT